ncbi:MAG TPA: sulfotransferase domain-containing protein, partial [Promineifilum sp.]|nr:sulfotransferase domain-containing protein [Promineifilum sp.]
PATVLADPAGGMFAWGSGRAGGLAGARRTGAGNLVGTMEYIAPEIVRGEDPDRMDDAQVAAMFNRHIELVEKWLARQPNVDTLYIHYSDVMADPLPEINRMCRFFDRDLDAQAMAEVVDPDLYRNRKAEAVVA